MSFTFPAPSISSSIYNPSYFQSSSSSTPFTLTATPGTAAANKVLVLDSSKNITSINANKALVLDSSKNITSINSLTSSFVYGTVITATTSISSEQININGILNNFGGYKRFFDIRNKTRLYVADDLSNSWLAAFKSLTTSTGTAITFRKQDETEIGSITFNASTVSINTSSDYRLKKNIEPLDGLSIIKKLNPVKWKWLADDSPCSGFIAHELQEHLPSLVIGEKDGLNKDGKPDYQSVNYAGLIGIIVAAIKEQNELIEALKQELDILKSAKSFGEFKKNKSKLSKRGFRALRKI